MSDYHQLSPSYHDIHQEEQLVKQEGQTTNYQTHQSSEKSDPLALINETETTETTPTITSTEEKCACGCTAGTCDCTTCDGVETGKLYGGTGTSLSYLWENDDDPDDDPHEKPTYDEADYALCPIEEMSMQGLTSTEQMYFRKYHKKYPKARIERIKRLNRLEASEDKKAAKARKKETKNWTEADYENERIEKEAAKAKSRTRRSCKVGSNRKAQRHATQLHFSRCR